MDFSEFPQPIPRILSRVEIMMASLMSGQEANGHGPLHCRTVARHAAAAIFTVPADRMKPGQALAILCAALLHEVDDAKLFETKNYSNARWILSQALPESIIFPDAPDLPFIVKGADVEEAAIKMISAVSCSQNGLTPVNPPEAAIPRDCDRLEAIGRPGVARCLLYGQAQGRPFRLAHTPRPRCEAEVWQAAAEERFLGYLLGHPSVSTLDHFYDKILHLLKPGSFVSANPYVLERAKERSAPVVDFLLRCEREKAESYEDPCVQEFLLAEDVDM